MEVRGNKEFDHLILKLNKENNRYEDITRKVIYLKDNQTSWFVVFDNKQSYHFKKTDVLVSINPTQLDLKDKKVLINNVETKVYAILKFERLGYKVFLNGESKYYFKPLFTDKTIEFDFINFDISKTDNKVFNYYKALSKYASDLTKDENSIETLMYKLYDKISSINPKSVLQSYNNQKILSRIFDDTKLIYPFNTNSSQNQAIYNTFHDNLTVISGPPGTGKTQVILNIIANCIYQNKKVAVISNNNTAVENVYIKMKEYGFDFLLAYLGNRDNVDKFFEQHDNIKETIEKFKEYEGNDYNIFSYKQTIDTLNSERIKIQNINSQILKLEEEKKHYINKYSTLKKFEIENIDYNKFVKLQNYILKIKKLNFINKLVFKYIYKVSINSDDQIKEFIDYLNAKYYDFKIEFLNKQKKESEDFLSKNNVNELTKKLKEESYSCFCNYIYNKFSNKNFLKFDSQNYKKFFTEFTDRYPVTLSTTHSLLRNCNHGFLYDLVIIDEASQSDILTSLLTMHVSKNMVIIGDNKQLSQIDNQDIYYVSEQLANHFNIPQYYQYKENSILESVINLPINVRNTLLREHYRCESRIIDFCNKKFYDNKLIICTNKSIEDSLVVVHTVEGNHARKNPNGSGQYNDREAQEILKILSETNETDIGIITPFRAQADYIYNLIKKDYPTVEVDTIHKYQGRQKKIIILSTVVNDLKDSSDDPISNFVTNKRLLNVAISRAIDKIYLIVSDKVYNSKNNIISQFIDYIKYYSNSDIKGEVVSIFDELYQAKYENIKSSPLYKKVDSYAEELVLKLLKKIIKDFENLKIAMHVRLSDLITDYSGFTKKEIEYINHQWSHVDFVLFDKLTYKPVLCIEVDGTTYHDYSKRQINHDIIKEKVLKQNNHKFLRIKTNNSDEQQKIISMLKDNNVSY